MAPSRRDAVLRLQAAQRELVMLVHWDGFTIAEAAKLLALNPSTARSRYSAAREALRAAPSENAQDWESAVRTGAAAMGE